MEKYPLISVVLCTYNDEKYIADSIQSVLDQTFRDFEFIIWNDGSTDNTENIIKSFDDERIRYYYHENTGIGIASKMACEKAKGKYIARIDGDDICIANRFQEQVSFLEKHHEYVVVSSAVYYINEDGNVIGRSFPITENWAIKQMLKKSDPIVNPASMFLREVYLKTGGYIGIRQREDYFLFSRICRYGKIKILSMPLIKYRLRKNSLSYFVEGASYDSILNLYRNKMIDDDIVKDRDVELYNNIFLESRRETILSKDVNNSRKIRTNRIISKFFQIKIMCGCVKFICFLKNIYCYLRYL